MELYHVMKIESRAFMKFSGKRPE